MAKMSLEELRKLRGDKQNELIKRNSDPSLSNAYVSIKKKGEVNDLFTSPFFSINLQISELLMRNNVFFKNSTFNFTYRMLYNKCG